MIETRGPCVVGGCGQPGVLAEAATPIIEGKDRVAMAQSLGFFEALGAQPRETEFAPPYPGPGKADHGKAYAFGGAPDCTGIALARGHFCRAHHPGPPSRLEAFNE